MKKNIKRIGAWIAIILLIGLYASTLISAIFDTSYTKSFFKASITATIIIPVMLYGYILAYRYLNSKKKDE